jgi:hypothetical protein
VTTAEQRTRTGHLEEIGGRQEEVAAAGDAVRIAGTRLRGKPIVQGAMERLSGAGLGRGERRDERVGLRADPDQPLRIGRAISPPEVSNPAVLNALAANVWARQVGPRPLKTVLFVGAERRVVASDVAWDFAAMLAQEQRGCVLLIDDHPGILHRDSDLPGQAKEEPGFTLQPFLDDAVSLLPPAGGRENLSVLRIGAPPLLSASVLQSAAFERFLGRVCDLFGAVVVNAPHPALQPEMLLLCRHVDGVVLVVESERTRRQSAMWTAQQIEESGGHLLGVVLSRRRFRIPEWIYRWI